MPRFEPPQEEELTEEEARLAALPPRIRVIVEAIDGGATYEKADIEGKMALSVTHKDGARQLTVISKEELALIRVAIPKFRLKNTK
ncbi:MAG: hypothetical protein R3C68_02370 [Myxococcota bacterium]